MRAFFVLGLFFLIFLLFASSSLGNIDLTPNSSKADQAAALTATPLVITVQESPPNTTQNAAIVPVTGGCADPTIVQPGDWLLKIAAKCNTSLSAILLANPQIINPDLIYPNQQLIMRNNSAAGPVPVTGLGPSIQSGAELRVQAINLLPNTPVKIGIGPKNAGYYTVLASNVTDGSGYLTTHITVPATPDSETLWVIVVTTTSTPPVQVMSPPFYIHQP